MWLRVHKYIEYHIIFNSKKMPTITYQSCVDGLSASFFLYELENSIRHLKTQIIPYNVMLYVYYLVFVKK